MPSPVAMGFSGKQICLFNQGAEQRTPAEVGAVADVFPAFEGRETSCAAEVVSVKFCKIGHVYFDTLLWISTALLISEPMGRARALFR
jgi:hypothetical protein